MRINFVSINIVSHSNVLIYMKNQFFIYPYEKVLKTHNYFQHININLVFLLNILILYGKQRQIFAKKFTFIS